MQAAQELASSAGTIERKEAEALEVKWKLEAYRKQQWDEEPSRTFDELMLAYLKATDRDKRSTERDRFSAKRLYPFSTGRELSTLHAADICVYIDQRRSAGRGAGHDQPRTWRPSTRKAIAAVLCR